MDISHARTFSILKEMANGKRITIDGYRYAMTIDMEIIIIAIVQGSEEEKPLNTDLTLCQFNNLLDKHNINMVLKL